MGTNGGDVPGNGPEKGHHVSGGRNIIRAGGSHTGDDIFFAAVQMTRMPMLLTDPRQNDNPIVFCNQAFEELSGYTQQEILGRNCRFLQGPDTDHEALARIRDCIRRRVDVHEELFNYRKDGHGFWNALFISPVFDADGKLIYFFASQLDVTRRREAEAVIRQAQRLETLGTMASGVAHEFNNLMTVVLGSLEQIERGVSAESNDHRRIDRAVWAARQAGRLTQQMLSFARRQFHDNRVLDLNELLRNFDGVLGQIAGVNVRVVLDLAPVSLPVEIDAGQMELALINLVRNAADAMPTGGTLTVQTRNGHDGAELTLRDTGTGMMPEVASRAIEPFFTTKPPGAGTGLGLSMVNGFAAQSGGQMRIDTAPGRGTAIILHFPRAGGAPGSGATDCGGVPAVSADSAPAL